MELKGAFVELGRKVWLRRGLIRLFIRCGSISNEKNINNNAAAASCSSSSRHVLEEGGGVMRMKIVVKKSDLEHLVLVSSTGVKAPHKSITTTTTTRTLSSVNVKVPYSYSTAEQRLNNLLWKKQSASSSSSSSSFAAKPLKGNISHKCWSPALQSIPESRDH